MSTLHDKQSQENEEDRNREYDTGHAEWTKFRGHTHLEGLAGRVGRCRLANRLTQLSPAACPHSEEQDNPVRE